VESFIDSFGNRCTRFFAQQGALRLSNSTLLDDPGLTRSGELGGARIAGPGAANEVLPYLLNSRYCEVDRFSMIAGELFGEVAPGWGRVQAICNWVNTKSASDINTRVPTKNSDGRFFGTLRSLQGFSASRRSLCAAPFIFRAVCDGYLGDIRVPPSATPMDFSAGLKRTSKIVGGPSMLAIIIRALAAC